MLNLQPPALPPRCDGKSPETTKAFDRRRHDDAVLAALAVTLVGVVGFLGLLIAGSLVPEGALVLRVLALTWFAAFGALYVKVSNRIS